MRQDAQSNSHPPPSSTCLTAAGSASWWILHRGTATFYYSGEQWSLMSFISCICKLCFMLFCPAYYYRFFSLFFCLITLSHVLSCISSRCTFSGAECPVLSYLVLLDVFSVGPGGPQAGVRVWQIGGDLRGQQDTQVSQWQQDMTGCVSTWHHMSWHERACQHLTHARCLGHKQINAYQFLVFLFSVSFTLMFVPPKSDALLELCY